MMAARQSIRARHASKVLSKMPTGHVSALIELLEAIVAVSDIATCLEVQV